MEEIGCRTLKRGRDNPLIVEDETANEDERGREVDLEEEGDGVDVGNSVSISISRSGFVASNNIEEDERGKGYGVVAIVFNKIE